MIKKITARPLLAGLGYAMVLCLAATTLAQAAWFDLNYSCKRRIVIQSSQVQGTSHLEFPVLITQANLDAAFFTNCQQTDPDNMDIIFTNEAEDTRLYREIAYYDAGNQELEAWVRIPSLSGTTDTVIYMYYGNPGVGMPDDPETWVGAYRGVWHIQEIPTGLPDDVYESTSNSNQATSQNMESGDQQGGKISGSLNFDGVDEYLDCGADTSLEITGQLTLSAWIAIASSTTDVYMSVISKKSAYTSANGYGMNYQPNNNDLRIYGNGIDFGQAAGQDLDTSWHYIVEVVNNTATALFIDGVDVTTDDALGALTSDTQALHLGKRSGTVTNDFSGSLDEIRIQDKLRSPEWIRTEYNNQNTPGSFYQAEAEQTQGTPTPPPTLTQSLTATISPTPTISPTRTISPTYTASPTISVTSTFTQTLTPAIAAPDLSNVIVYPNPYLAEFYTRNQTTFINLPAQATIRIYSLDGRLVRTISKDDPGNRAVWNLTNEQNRPVASGIYLYIIQTIKEDRRGKIFLVR